MFETLKNFVKGLKIINTIKKAFEPKGRVNIDMSKLGNNDEISDSNNIVGNNNIVVSSNNSGNIITGSNNTNSGNSIKNINYNYITGQGNSSKANKIKDEIIYDIQLLTALLKRHCIIDSILSEETEKDSRRNDGLSKEEIVKLERERIDMEITSLFRKINNNIELFELYSSEDTLLIKDLKSFMENMWGYAFHINLFIMYKFSYYFLHSDSNYFFTKLQEWLPAMQKISGAIDNRKQEIFKKLKNTIEQG